MMSTTVRKPMLVTKYGTVHEDGALDSNLDSDVYLQWVKNYRLSAPKNAVLPATDEDWVIFYKRTLAKDYAARYYNISDMLP